VAGGTRDWDRLPIGSGGQDGGLAAAMEYFHVVDRQSVVRRHDDFPAIRAQQHGGEADERENGDEPDPDGSAARGMGGHAGNPGWT